MLRWLPLVIILVLSGLLVGAGVALAAPVEAKKVPFFVVTPAEPSAGVRFRVEGFNFPKNRPVFVIMRGAQRSGTSKLIGTGTGDFSLSFRFDTPGNYVLEACLWKPGRSRNWTCQVGARNVTVLP